MPTYNSLKALKGAMFYLPLALEKTMETLNEVGIDSNHLPDPSYMYTYIRLMVMSL